MRSSWISVALNTMTGVFLRDRTAGGSEAHGGEGRVRTEAEIGMVHLQAKECQELPTEARSRRGMDSP